MSRFNPTSRVMMRDNDPELLAGAVLDSLTRKLYYKLSWGVGTTLIVSLLTCGIAPIVAMLGWLRGVISQHEQQFWHLAEWMRLQTGDPDAAELQNLSYGMRFSPALAVVSAIGLIMAVAGVVMHFDLVPFDLPELYGFAFQHPQALPGLLFVLGLSTAATGNWVHLAKHQQRVERYLRYFNVIAEEHGLDPLPLPKLDLGLRPLWILGGGLLTWAGAIWGLPVMLAGGAHRRYTIGTSVLVRSMLAERMRTMLANRRPPVRVPAPVVAARFCVRPNCRAPLSSVASFCPRCGTRAARLMDVVA